MTGVYRVTSGVLCAAFAMVAAAFLLIPNAVLGLFDRWSGSLGLATSAGPASPFFVALAVAYMAVVTSLAWSMARHPRDAASPRLLAQAKAASSLVSFALFLRQPQLILLVNGIVDGGIALVLVLLRRALRAESAA